MLKSVEYYLRVNRQDLLAVQDGLTQVLPPELLEHTQTMSVQGGVLTLAVPDAAGKCLLETIFRGPAFDRLKKIVPGIPLRRVKVMLT